MHTKRETEQTNYMLYVITMEQLKQNYEKYPYLHHLKESMSPVRYCKTETYDDSLQGVVKIPKIGKCRNEISAFGFCVRENDLIFVDDSGVVEELLSRLGKSATESNCVTAVLLRIFEGMIENDVIDLQQEEEKLSQMEERLLKNIPEHFYETVIRFRKQLSGYHAYYEQMLEVGEQMIRMYANHLSPEEVTAWKTYISRVDRLHNYVEQLRDYLLQIRELYQSLIAVQQNNIINILTVVTTIFLPLSLIAGWYGMNFPNMPEFHYRYAYPIVVFISILIIVLETIFFKKKKMF